MVLRAALADNRGRGLFFLQVLLGILYFPIKSNVSVLVEQLDCVERRAFRESNDAERWSFRGRTELNPRPQTDSMCLSEGQKLAHQSFTATDTKARSAFRDPDVTISIDNTTPEVSRVAEFRRSDTAETFGVHPIASECGDEIFRSYLNRFGWMTLFSNPVSSFEERYVGAQEGFEFDEMLSIAFSNTYTDDRGAFFTVIDPSVAEKKSYPVRRLFRKQVKSFSPVVVDSVRFGASTQCDAVSAKSVTDVVGADAECLGNHERSFAFQVAIDRIEPLFFGQPNSSFGVVVHEKKGHKITNLRQEKKFTVSNIRGV